MLGCLFLGRGAWKSNNGGEGAIGLYAGRDLVTQFPSNHFAQGHISEAHPGRSQDQRPVPTDQLPDPLPNNVYQKL